MAAETTAQTADNKSKTFFRKPNGFLWTATSIVITYAVWCVLLLILTASGQLLNSQSFGCMNSNEDLVESRVKHEAGLVYLCSGLSLPFCILLLLEFWRRKGFYTQVSLGASCALFVIVCLSFTFFVKKEAQEIKEFRKHYVYLSLQHLKDTQNQLAETTCDELNSVHRWQAEFQCCGLHSYQDWGPSSLPESCLCDGKDNGSGCVGVGHSLVYEKPCLPTVLSLVEKRSITFWTIMIIWITIIGSPIAIFMLLMMAGFSMCCYWMVCETCCYKLNVFIYKMRGGEEMVPVVFIKKNNNNQTEEEDEKDVDAKGSSEDDSVVLDVEGGTKVEGGGQEEAEEDWKDDNPLRMIPLSELRRLQEELDPPPVQHQVKCLCIIDRKPRNFYTVLLEEGSPLLPSGAVLVDANKPTTVCLWAEGPHVFDVDHIVWPRERNPNSTQPLLL